MAKQKIFKICWQCSGTKEIVSANTGEMVVCNICNGEGYIEWGYLKLSQEE